MATSLSFDDVKAQIGGQDEPQNDEQTIALRIWEALPADQWLLEDDFTELLAKIAGLEEPWQSHDVSALFVSLHAADYIEVRRVTPQLRQVRRSPERPRFRSWVELAEADQQALVVWQQEAKDAELERAEEARRELQRPQLEAEREELAEAIDDSPRVRELREEVKDLESEVRGLRAKVTLLESKFGGTED
jgi:hypothetical protein